jgi:predicted nucleic acid-binding protein
MNKYFVVDTNNLISANLIASSVSSQAFDKARHLGILVFSDQTIAEFSVSFIRPKFDKYLSLNKRLKTIKEFKKKWITRVCQFFYQSLS